MNFVHVCNKKHRHDTMCGEFAWHGKILTNWLRFISLFVDITEMTKAKAKFKARKAKAKFKARKARRIGQTLYYGKSNHSPKYIYISKYKYIEIK